MSAPAASTTSGSSASSSVPSHGLRSRVGHLLPKHALFQVHLYIDQLSNVPLIHGEFDVRWKFKNVQSGSGLLSRMKAPRTWSGARIKGKGKAKNSPEIEVTAADEEEEGEDDEDDDDGDSSHESGPYDDSYPPWTNGPSNYLASEPILDTPMPSSTPIAVGNNQSTTSVESRSEARGMTAWAQLQSYNVRWAHTVNVVVQMDVHRETRDLLPNELKLVVMQRVIPGDPDSPRQPRLGEVYLNLAEYADAGPVTRRYLLRQSKTNATLRLTIELEHIGGEKNYKPPPLRKGEILASVSGLLSNNSLLNTRLARELDLYIGDDVSTVGELAHPYADANGHIDADKLASSFGLRTTENLIEALFNPVPSASAVPTPFTYYAPPKTVEPDESLSSDSLSNSTEVRSMGSGGDSASYAASISSAEAQLSAGLADGHRHWWQKKRSRPGTPIMRNGRPPTPGQPVPVREG